MRRRLCLPLLLMVAFWTGVPNAWAAPARAVHALRWFVHADLLAPMGRKLSFYEQLLAQRLAEADVVLQGFQGPADTPCCTGLEAFSVASFGAPGDGLDVITSDAELNALAAMGPGAYLVRSVFCCGCGDVPNASVVGCADTPGDFLVVSLDSENDGFLANTIAHERGHNAGLVHVFDNPCQLMAPFAGGSCLDVSECQAYRGKANTSGASCACLGDTVSAPPLPDETPCPNASGCGLCSGGLCGACGSEAGLRLVGTGGAESASTARSDDALVLSALTAGWRPQGAVDAGVEVTGLAYASRRGVLYGIARGPGSDVLITLDPATGRKSGEVGTLGQSGFTALAYDPGPDPAVPPRLPLLADRLLAIQVDNELFGQSFSCPDPMPCFSALVEIDPDDASARMLGEIEPNQVVAPGGITGLAYDPASQALFGSSILGVHRIGTECARKTCTADLLEGRLRSPSSLTFDSVRGRLIRVGTQGQSTSYEVIAPQDGRVERSLGIDPFTSGAIAAVPVPEPARLWMELAAAAVLMRRWRTASRRTRVARASDGPPRQP